ncbi:MAG TPA: arginine deiminase-related protein [Puia sp.]|jgi:hypothetical protein|nr:arginine deiminase-related protein [Puia sp.]
MQTTSHILMIRPVNFTFNAETAVNNAFQTPPAPSGPGAGNPAASAPQQQALHEFNDFVKLLRENDIDVTVIEDTPEPYTPDSIFPNNWVSFHEQGLVCLYPMYAANRRLERKPGVLQQLGIAFRIGQTLDFSSYEQKGVFLEGTGSMVLDREKKIAYACLSPRTDLAVLLDFCGKTGYTPEVFTAVDGQGQAIYHTNVMMCVADRYVVACLDSLPVESQRDHLAATIHSSGKELIPISLEQMNRFAGNMLQVHNRSGERILVMSSQAYHSLSPEQIKRLTTFNRVLHSSLTTIETNGGGSARCMMAEIHLEPL